jgi:dihydrofolate synthase/folylpolyglutamate synthase
MTFCEAQQYLDSFVNWEEHSLRKKDAASWNLERMRHLLRLLGDPAQNFNIIHVAGSKGKGSTCALTAHILATAGYKTGLYTSPHLNTCRERIRLLGVSAPSAGQDASVLTTGATSVFPDAISEDDLCAVIDEIKSKIELMRFYKKWGRLTFFEVYTALALYYFRKKKADWVVWETGLGGRLDATNAVASRVCAITPISLEHTAVLGNTLAQIAREKAAIIKSADQKVVLAPQEKQAGDVLRQRCARYFIQPLGVGDDIRWEVVDQNLEYQTINIYGTRGKYSHLELPLLGRHQAVNAAVAVGIFESLQELGLRVSPRVVDDGLKDVFWPGRLEIIRGTDPLIILDGAHNQASAIHLVESLREIFFQRGHALGGGGVTLILGICQDKDRKGICRELNKITQMVVATMADHPRAHKFGEEEFNIYFPGKSRIFTACVAQAVEYALQETEKAGLILITGSLFVVSEARRILSACSRSQA